MHERTNIRLSAADRSELETVAANRNSRQKHVWRAKIVLLTADAYGTADIMRATGKAKTVIWRWQKFIYTAMFVQFPPIDFIMALPRTSENVR